MSGIPWRAIKDLVAGKASSSDRYFVAGQEFADEPPEGCLCHWKNENYGEPWQRVSGLLSCPVHRLSIDDLDETQKEVEEIKRIVRSWTE